MAKKFLYHPAKVEGFNNEDFVTSTISLNCDDLATTIGDETYDGQKFTVAIKQEKVSDHDSLDSLSDALQERWNLDLQGVIDKFYSAGCFTAVTYKTEEALNKVAEGDLDGAHAIAQDAVDQYQFNVRKAKSKVSKAEVQEVMGLKAEAQKLGMTLEQYIAAVREMVGKGEV